jgi:nucleotide-binding universal stress UspA family protein
MANVRILCPVDFSPCSERAARYAMDLAAQLRAEVTLLHAWELPAIAVPEGALVFGADVMMRVDASLTEQLDAFAAKLRRPDVSLATRVVQGMPSFEIAKVAAETKASLIVMGTHGRTGLSHLLIGSVAERVVRTSHIPVLTVPPDRSAPTKAAASAPRASEGRAS